MGHRNVWKKSMGCPNCLSKPSDSMPLFCWWHQQLSTQNWWCRADESPREVRTILWGGKEGIRHSASPPSLCSLKGTQGRSTWADLCYLSQRGRVGRLQHKLPPSQVSVSRQDHLPPDALLVSFVALSASGEGCGGELVPWQSVCSQPGRAQRLWTNPCVPTQSIPPQSTLSMGKRNPFVRLIQAEGKPKVKHCFDFAFWHGLELSPAISEWHCCHLFVPGLTH